MLGLRLSDWQSDGLFRAALSRGAGKGAQLYGLRQCVVLVGHSMGGLLAHMQAVTITSGDWDRAVGPSVSGHFERLPADSVLHRALL